MKKRSVVILGATGMVGQRLVQLLYNHPWFNIIGLAASGGSAGKTYKESAKWFIEKELPEEMENFPVIEVEAKGVISLAPDMVFSALPTGVAKEIEVKLAEAGIPVISEASCFRMDKDIPIVVPEVNPTHLKLIEAQRKKWSGYIVKKPNCTTIGLVMALKPLMDKFGIRNVVVTTLQALSGAGYGGVPSMAIIDNIIPYIEEEEEKVEEECLKILGTPEKFAKINVSANCNRVPTLEGHLECVDVELAERAELEEVKKVLREFRGEPQKFELPTAPIQPIIVFDEQNRPQPRFDRFLGSPERARGMGVGVGRIRENKVFKNGIKFICLSHNTIRGASGNSILVAELLRKKGI